MGAIVGSTLISHTTEPHRVYVREHWGDDWTEVTHLYCNSLTWCTAPQIPHAVFEWRYGEGMRPTESAFSEIAPQDYLDWYINVEVDQWDEATDDWSDTPLQWYGIVLEDGRNPDGAETRQKPKSRDTYRVASGRQMLLAYGLERLLETSILSDCWYSDGDKELNLGRMLAFNPDTYIRPDSGVDKKKRIELPGNRSLVKGEEGAYTFATQLRDAAVWTPLDIIEYLLAYHPPKDATGASPIPWKIDTNRKCYVPTYGRPVIDAHGQTVKAVIDSLLSRQRGVSYYCEVRDAEPFANQVVLCPFTFADEPLTFPDGSTLPSNSDVQTIDFDAAMDVEAHVKRTAMERYDQVQAVGGRIVCCGTAAALDSTLVAHYSAADKTGYDAGASGAGDYPAATEIAERDERNALVRASDKYQRVYSWYGLPTNWDGKVGDGVGGETNDLFPYTELELDSTVASAFYKPELRFLPALPLKTCHNYAGSNIADETIPDSTPADQKWQYRPIYVCLRLPDRTDWGDATDRYAETDKLASAADVELLGSGAGREVSASVQIQHDAPGIILRLHGGAEVEQYDLAGNDFSPLADTGDHTPIFDWEDNLLVTFAVEADWHIQKDWPETASTSREWLRILRIDASHRCGLHYVAPGTVVSCDDGILNKTTAGGFIRDDRELLLSIAKLAYQWYGTDRQALSLSIARAYGDLNVGELITSFGSGETLETIRTVVTSRRIDLAQSIGQTHRTTLETQWAELDVVKLL